MSKYGKNQMGSWNVLFMTATGCCLIHLDANSRLYNYIATSTERGSLSPDELWYCHTHHFGL